ncbi:hypothetical protein [Billgrantia montanilacus]|uniref:Uncharacterized protein n=1 Tax=Billgrantia montanilacus TaxID=2282305 RepID=A0A368TNF9_9GAMM|nr:hypothetical protein [Halomonas montanilacus]RCV86225.1 hypothetical protein DU505_21420 [Halomonas montanilacus]
MNRSRYFRVCHKALAILAILFGAVTILAGFRVLAGADPGYVVSPPLLIYNTVMGFTYVGVGAIAWRSLDFGKYGASVIFLLNLIVLAALFIAYVAGSAVAVESLLAMMLRTVVWFVIFVGLWWLSRRDFGSEQRG